MTKEDFLVHSKYFFAAVLCALVLAGCAHSTAEETSAPAEPAPVISVACVGDSNTEGYGATGYPSFLAERLGDGYIVDNYGVSGTTAMDSGDYPYSTTTHYDASVATKPDIVVLMFGTNDTNGASWRGVETFSAEYDKLVRTYVELDSKPRVIICTPPAPHLEEQHTWRTYGIQPAVYDSMNAAIAETAEAYDLTLVDIYGLTKDHPEWFLDDGIHLTDEGASAVADAVAEAVLTD